MGIEGEELPLALERGEHGGICGLYLALAAGITSGAPDAPILNIPRRIESRVESKESVRVRVRARDRVVKIFGVHDNHGSFGKPGGLSPRRAGAHQFLGLGRWGHQPQP